MEKLFINKKKLILILLIIFLIIVVFIFYSLKDNMRVNTQSKVVQLKSSLKEVENINKEEQNKTVEEVYVDIKGEVISPGVYKLEGNAKVIDVINLAGGLGKNANTRCINLSKKIEKEMVIYIHSNKEVDKIIKDIKSSPVSQSICPELKNDAYVSLDTNIISDTKNNEETNTKININTANKDELMTLPGIGETKANDIINYRVTNGFFKTIEDIKNVSGIGDATFNNFKSLITI